MSDTPRKRGPGRPRKIEIERAEPEKPKKQPKRYKRVPLAEADGYWKKGW